MKTSILPFVALVLGVVATDMSRAVPTCRRTYSRGQQQSTSIHCNNIRFEGGTGSMDRIFRETSVVDEIKNKTHTFAELASTTKYLGFVDSRGNLDIGGDTLATFQNLNELYLHATPPSYVQATEYDRLSISSFRSAPRLNALTIGNYVLGNDATLAAILSLKDRLNWLKFYGHLSLPGRDASNPCAALTEIMAKFTNLTTAKVDSVCADREFPTSTFRNSAAKLQSITVNSCKLSKVPADFFRGMRELRELFLGRSGTTSIEAGAFDDLVNLERVSFEFNQVRRPPGGLFKNTKKLRYVNWQGNGVENLSRNNFTHVNDFANFHIAI